MLTLDRQAIEKLLPHRDPFLFVDEVIGSGTDASGNAWLETRWTVKPDMDVFRGHYPGNPILPGVLIQEHTFQSGALLIYTTENREGLSGGMPVLTKVEDARFRRMVLPGMQLTTRVELYDSLSNARFLRAKVQGPDGLVARLSCVLALA
ncbi:MAG: 3-hydroxyacyl-[acyl-carrier-protein] dehydratase [Planctomycetota bacterium]|jgi:3-hydroxyacyl-[acyl-carrier-protein] dehydratase